MDLINLIIKPTSECNLRCKYCYHASTNYVCGSLSMDKIKKLFELASDEYKEIKITWHGGEPMLLGREFYEEVFTFQQELEKTKNVSFMNTMQTNGTLIDRKWGKFFKKYHIIPGISFDGPTHNDVMRQNSKDIIKGLKVLKSMKINAGCLAVINKHNIDQTKLYQEMSPLCAALKFNPIFSPNGDEDFKIDENEYIKQTIALFDYWLYDKKGKPVEPLHSYMYKSLGVPYNSCVNSSCLGKWLDIDSKGVIRTCGQSDSDQFIIGHIDNISSLSEVFVSESFNNLLRKAIERRKKCLANCHLFKECQGNCIFKASIEGGIENLNGFSCKAFKTIYSYVKTKTIKLIKDKVPLNKLNPIVRGIITDAMSKNSAFIMGLTDE